MFKVKNIGWVDTDAVLVKGTGSAAYTNAIYQSFKTFQNLDIKERVVLESHSRSSGRKFLNFCLASFEGASYSVEMLNSVDNQNKLKWLVYNKKVDFVVLNGFGAAALWNKQGLNMPYIYIMYDRHSDLMEAVIKGHPFPTRILLKILGEVKRCGDQEEKIIRKALGVICVSHTDARYIENLDERQVIWAPPAFDFKASFFRNNASRKNRVIYLGMLGNTSFYPNVEGMKFFIDSFLPSIGDNIHLVLAGRGTEIFNAVDNRMTGLGFIEDLSSFWDKIDILMVPSLSGSGIGVKVCEAIARNVPLLVTPIALRGQPNFETNFINILHNDEEWRMALNWERLDALRKRNVEEDIRKNFLSSVSKDILENFMRGICGF